jgi:NADP-dependent 3-hydroxy acid dehydrogenase YdfG
MLSTTLAGKVAVITGATSGIGRAVALDLAAAGVKVLAIGRREAELDKLCADAPGTLAIAGDVLDPGLPGHALRQAMSTHGACDILFHAAGILYAGGIDDVDTDEMCHMARVNFEAAVRTTYTFLKHFKKQGHGQLLHVSSVVGVKARPGGAVYAATKFGIEGLIESLRMEVAGTGIRLSVIRPGIVITGLHDGLPVHPAKGQGISAPLLPEDIARCARFILEQPAHVRIPVITVLPGEQSI